MTRLLLIGAMTLVGCKTFDAGQYAPDPGTAPGTALDADTGEAMSDPFTDIDCETAPLVNWVNFGNAFMTQNCNRRRGVGPACVGALCRGWGCSPHAAERGDNGHPEDEAGDLDGVRHLRGVMGILFPVFASFCGIINA